MRFWDSSALVPLIIAEDRSASCRRALHDDADIAAWALTRIEVISAIRRKERAAELDPDQVRAGLRRLDASAARWTELDALGPVRERAERLLAVHALTAADALQLAAALELSEDRPRRLPFVVADPRLASAAEAEGFPVVRLAEGVAEAAAAPYRRAKAAGHAKRRKVTPATTSRGRARR